MRPRRITHNGLPEKARLRVHLYTEDLRFCLLHPRHQPPPGNVTRLVFNLWTTRSVPRPSRTLANCRIVRRRRANPIRRKKCWRIGTFAMARPMQQWTLRSFAADAAENLQRPSFPLSPEQLEGFFDFRPVLNASSLVETKRCAHRADD